MSKKDIRMIEDQLQRLIDIRQVIAEMEKNVVFLNKEAEPEAYRRWYLSYQAVRNLEGLVSESLEDMKTYLKKKKRPWRDRFFKKS